MRIALIWAMDKNRLIGSHNDLPWRLASDLAHFKKTTLGKPVIMGRKTWDSLGRPLPGRPNIVVSRSEKPNDCPAHWCGSLEEAIATASQWAEANRCEELIIMGGAQLYQLAFPRADRLYITQVDGAGQGDTYLPVFDMSDFTCTERQTCEAGPRDDFNFTLTQWDRRATGA